MMKIFLCVLALISYSSGFFLGGGGGLLGGGHPPPLPPPPPQRHLVKILSEDPRISNALAPLANGNQRGLAEGHAQVGVLSNAHQLNNGQIGLLNNGQSGVLNGGAGLNNGQSGLLNNGYSSALLNNGQSDLLNGGQSGLLNGGQSGLINNGPSLNNGQPGLINSGPGLINGSPITVIRVIHEGLPLNSNQNQPRILRVIHEHSFPTSQNLASGGLISHGGGLNNLNNVGGSLGAGQLRSVQNNLGQNSGFGQNPLGPAQLAPLISSAPNSLLSSGPDQSYSYPAPIHHYRKLTK